MNVFIVANYLFILVAKVAVKESHHMYYSVSRLTHEQTFSPVRGRIEFVWAILLWMAKVHNV